MKPLIKLLAKDVARSLSTKRLAKAFCLLDRRAVEMKERVVGEVQVCALQLEAKAYSSLSELVRDIDSHLRSAVNEGAELVCFPEFFGVFTLFASPFVRTAFRQFTKKTPSGDDAAAGDSGFDLAQYFGPFSFLPERYIDLMGRFALRYGIWISCGTIPAYDSGRLYNRQILLDDKGKLVGTQDKLNLVPMEKELGFSHGEVLEVFETPLGKIAIPICMDATYFEIFKIAKGLGADFIILPIANMEPYNYHLALRGAAMRVTETNLVAIKPAFVSGGNFPIEITGRAGIYFPLGFQQKSRETSSGEGSSLVVATLDINALKSHTPERFCLKNQAFNQKLIYAYSRNPYTQEK